MSQNETEHSTKVILVTGASSGFGRLNVETLAGKGYIVYAAMREPEGRNATVVSELNQLAVQNSWQLEVIALDVTSDESVEAAVKQVVNKHQRIDVLVNNAGVMNVGVTEGYTLDQIKQQMDVNYYGPVRMDRAVIPHMRAQKNGLLIHVTSLAGRLVFPYFGIYCASKFALEALAESYRYELSDQGIDSVIVEPGPFGTSLISNSPKPEDNNRIADYGSVAETPDKILSSFEEFYRSEDALNPQMVADDIAHLIEIPINERPMRTVSGLDYGLLKLNKAVEPVQKELLAALGMSAMDPLESHAG